MIYHHHDMNSGLALAQLRSQLDQEDAWYWYKEAGWCLMQLNRPKEAIESLQEALKRQVFYFL
jgi:hypothetical protein